MTEEAKSYTNTGLYDAVNGIIHILKYPGRLFAKDVFKGIAFMGAIGLILAGAALYLG